MELRKLLGHPYLISPDVERLDVTPLQTKENLIKASCKLEFLALMLPKLQAQGHRVLLVSSRSFVGDDVIADGGGVHSSRNSRSL